MYTLVDRAIGFAARAHEGQRRKIGKVPYVAHPFAVALILQQMGCNEKIVAAGLLHDTVEDTGITLDDIRREFGDEVAEIVDGCTEPPKKDAKWATRKLYMISTLREAPLAVKLVTATDKYHNLVHTLNSREVMGESVWKKFGGGKERQAWYFRTVLESVRANVPDQDNYPIFAQLAAVIDELFAGIPSRPPKSA
jgi:(p)ppGpp synthase/HD superfamily hydrolase